MFHLVPSLKCRLCNVVQWSVSCHAYFVTRWRYPHPLQQCYRKNLRFCDAFGVWGPHSLVGGCKIAGKKFNPMEVNLI